VSVEVMGTLLDPTLYRVTVTGYSSIKVCNMLCEILLIQKCNMLLATKLL